MSLLELKKFCQLGSAEQELMRQAMKRYNFSGRSMHRILKVARTIADLANSEAITSDHLAEAVQYRPKAE
jgi:magnesium chelatase family protein